MRLLRHTLVQRLGGERVSGSVEVTVTATVMFTMSVPVEDLLDLSITDYCDHHASDGQLENATIHSIDEVVVQ